MPTTLTALLTAAPPASAPMIVVAFVIPEGERESIDEAWVIERCAAELARFKVPRRVICVDAFPTTPSANGERVQRAVLRRRAAELLAHD